MLLKEIINSTFRNEFHEKFFFLNSSFMVVRRSIRARRLWHLSCLDQLVHSSPHVLLLLPIGLRHSLRALALLEALHDFHANVKCAASTPLREIGRNVCLHLVFNLYIAILDSIRRCHVAFGAAFVYQMRLPDAFRLLDSVVCCHFPRLFRQLLRARVLLAP